MSGVKNAETPDSRWNWLFKVSGTAALILGALFLAALISLISASLRPTAINGWLFIFQNNWLIVLFKLNAGLEGMQFDRLYGLNALDMAIMTLVAIMFLGLCAALMRTSKVGSITAALLPFLGIVVYIATKLAGRSAVMAAGLIISFVMLRSKIFSKIIAFVGILACVCLLVGDFGTSEITHSSTVALLVGIGYVLLMIWFFLVGRRLLQLV
jgi:hypothetical protein